MNGSNIEDKDDNYKNNLITVDTQISNMTMVDENGNNVYKLKNYKCKTFISTNTGRVFQVKFTDE